MEFASRALRIDAGDSQRWAEEAREVEIRAPSPAARLAVELVCASDIAGKDVSGSSDPYCILELVCAAGAFAR